MIVTGWKRWTPTVVTNLYDFEHNPIFQSLTENEVLVNICCLYFPFLPLPLPSPSPSPLPPPFLPFPSLSFLFSFSSPSLLPRVNPVFVNWSWNRYTPVRTSKDDSNPYPLKEPGVVREHSFHWTPDRLTGGTRGWDVQTFIPPGTGDSVITHTMEHLTTWKDFTTLKRNLF